MRSATEASENAIANLKVRLSHFDVIEECAKAESLLDRLRTSITGRDHEATIETSDLLATSLINLKERYSGFDSNMRRQLDLSVERAVSVADTVQRGEEAREDSRTKLRKSIREIHRVLMKIRFIIQEEQ